MEGGKWKAIIGMMGVNLGFGGVNILLKQVIDGGTNHMVIVTYRLSISAILLGPFAYYWERRSRPKLTFPILCYLFLGAFSGQTLQQYLFLSGLQYTSTTLACAFLNTVPVITFILALLFRQEKVNMKRKAGKAKVFGAAICTGGAILLSLYKGVPLSKAHESSNQGDSIIKEDKNNTQRLIIGSTFLMGGCLMWSSWFLLQAKIGKRYPCHYSSTAILNFFAAIQSVSISLVLQKNFSMWVLNGYSEILTVIYAGVVASSACYVVMSWCVKQRGPVFTAAFTPFTQIFAAIFDVSILHDQIYLGSVIGSILVILGLYILLWGKSNEAEECVIKQSLSKEDGSGDVESQVPVPSNSTVSLVNS